MTITDLLTCFIIDDEPYAIESLKEHVHACPELKLIGCATNPFEALKFLEDNPVDVVFLDINMGKMNGMELSKYLQCMVIWTTSHEEYALKSYDYENTVDYLMKPIEHDRFQIAIKKALQRFLGSTLLTDPDNAFSENRGTYLYKTIRGEKRISFNRIDYFEANRNNVVLNSGNDKLVVYATLKEVEESLPTNLFARVHKSFIVNKSKIVGRRFDKVILESGKIVPVGRSYRNMKE